MTRPTPKLDHHPLPMRRRENAGDIERVGDFRFVSDDVINLAIPFRPDGKGGWRWTMCVVPITRKPVAEKNEGEWSWDGNAERPTLEPSIHMIGVWHGWVKGGRLVEAS